jgi:peroxiredoxin
MKWRRRGYNQGSFWQIIERVKNMSKTIIAILMAAVICGVSCAAGEKEAVSSPKIGEKALEFTLASYDGKEVSLSDYTRPLGEGKIVVLEWFNYECPFVKYHYEKATMADLAAKYKDKDVVWIAINSTKHLKPEENKAWAEKYKLEYPILDDRSGAVGRAYGARTTPHMYIIDKEGKIVYSGAIDDSPMGRKKEGAVNYVDKALSELLSGKAVSIPETEPYGCSIKYAD